MKSKKIRCRKISKIGIDLSHTFCFAIRFNSQNPVSFDIFFLFRKCVHETEFIWNKLAKKDDHKRDEKMCTNETVLPNSNRKKQLPKPNGTNRTFRSFFKCLLFFLFINYWPAQTHKTRQIRENQQCQTKSNIHIYRRRREGECKRRWKKWMCLLKVETSD